MTDAMQYEISGLCLDWWNFVFQI